MGAGQLVSRIDIYEDIPVEVKTTTNLGEEADLRRKRPGYIEQLGIYCGMVDVGKGRIIVYQRETPPELSSPLVVYNVMLCIKTPCCTNNKIKTRIQ